MQIMSNVIKLKSNVNLFASRSCHWIMFKFWPCTLWALIASCLEYIVIRSLKPRQKKTLVSQHTAQGNVPLGHSPAHLTPAETQNQRCLPCVTAVLISVTPEFTLSPRPFSESVSALVWFPLTKKAEVVWLLSSVTSWTPSSPAVTVDCESVPRLRPFWPEEGR